MSSVNDEVVRQYLELMGFMVTQPRKHFPAGRVRRPEDEMDLLGFNPRPSAARKPAGLLWTGAEVRSVSYLLVGVRGWHAERFSPSLIAGSPEIVRFVDPTVVARAEDLLGGGPVARVLCVSALPVSAEATRQTLALLREHGVDGVLPFRTILVELAAMVDVQRNYDRSDLLQILRILKAHQLLNDAQLPLFSSRRPRRRAGGAPDRSALPGDPA